MAATTSNTQKHGLSETINGSSNNNNNILSNNNTPTATPHNKTRIKVAFDPHFFAPKKVNRKRKGESSAESSSGSGSGSGNASTSTSANTTFSNPDCSPSASASGDVMQVDEDAEAKSCFVADMRSEADLAMERSYQSRRRTSMTPHAFYKRCRLGGRPDIQSVNLGSLLLPSYKSSRGDTIGFASRLADRTYAPPLTTAFVPSTRNTSRPLLAVGDEEGSVSFVDASKPSPSSYSSPNPHSPAYTPPSKLTSFIEAHDNAIFDLKFSNDSHTFVTASADQEVRFWDTHTQRHLGNGIGHTGSVKALSWTHNSNSIFATIRLWDTRTSSSTNSALTISDAPHDIDPMFTIDRAHASATEQRKRNSIGRSVTRSVTSIAFLHNTDTLLASAGSCNGSLKLWDIRAASSNTRSKQTKALTESPDMTESNSGRPHGVSHIVADGEWLWALCTNSVVYGYTAANLTKAARIQLTDPDLVCASFWVRMALSNDARYLSCGSKNGRVFTWDVANSRRAQTSQSKAHQLVHCETSSDALPQSTEVGSVDWANDTLASCSDDMTVRLWRPQR
ncbi:hypothetical protein E3P99_02103 [Wallemia hederae]|uniref:Anaphase-promoting complex subunit 4 WD40 domain-containing protein n=1 Tax=Wallemia hederae TaxID=1540922 RepID=A0A4T0FLS7_9BASI|nr:hypothetical protein E3P99_02103 [Wallemia hederae]